MHPPPDLDPPGEPDRDRPGGHRADAGRARAAGTRAGGHGRGDPLRHDGRAHRPRNGPGNGADLSMSTLTGKSALVTGSTRGIGRGIAGRLAAAGANVVLNGFGDRHKIEELRRGLAEPNHVDVRYYEADLVDPAQIRRLAAFAMEAFGQVDILVNNAGVQHVAPIVE